MSLYIFQKIAEDRIREAVERGELDNLPGAGQPQNLEDDSNLPAELRIAYKVLKNAGFTPPELDLRKQIYQVEELLDNAPDERSRYQAMKRLNFLSLKLAALRPQSALLDEHHYASRVLDRLDKHKGEPPQK
ncbi:MAG: DnaJ family domain-containing protein [Thermodesulfobacteriota bacterium]